MWSCNKLMAVSDDKSCSHSSTRRLIETPHHGCTLPAPLPSLEISSFGFPCRGSRFVGRSRSSNGTRMHTALVLVLERGEEPRLEPVFLHHLLWVSFRRRVRILIACHPQRQEISTRHKSGLHARLGRTVPPKSAKMIRRSARKGGHAPPPLPPPCCCCCFPPVLSRVARIPRKQKSAVRILGASS